jgi:hypothetical protein
MVMCRSLSIHTAAAENEVKKSDEAEGILKYNVWSALRKTVRIENTHTPARTS